MDASIYATHWLLSLLCADLPIEICLKVIDFFLLDDYKTVFKIILAILKVMEEKVLKLKFDDALVILKNFSQEYFIDDVLLRSDYKHIK